MTDDNRIKEAASCLKSRITEMQWSIENNDIDNEKGLGMQDILEIKKIHCLEILLSWGGPSEWIRVIIDENTVKSVSFHYAHWFFVTEVTLTQCQQGIIESWVNQFILPCIDLNRLESGGYVL